MSGLSEYEYQLESSSGSEFRLDSLLALSDDRNHSYCSDDDGLDGLEFTIDYFFQLMALAEVKHYVKVLACEILTDYLNFANNLPMKRLPEITNWVVHELRNNTSLGFTTEALCMVGGLAKSASFATLKTSQRHELLFLTLTQKNPALHSEVISQFKGFWGEHPNDIIRFVKSRLKQPYNCVLDKAIPQMINYVRPHCYFNERLCARLILAFVGGAPSSAVTWLKAQKSYIRYYDKIYRVLTSANVVALTMPSDDEDDEASIEVSANETSSVNHSNSPENTMIDPVEVSSCDESISPSDEESLTTTKRRRTSSLDDEDCPAQPQTKRSTINVTHAVPKMFHFENCPVTINIVKGSQQSDDEELDAEEP